MGSPDRIKVLQQTRSNLAARHSQAIADCERADAATQRAESKVVELGQRLDAAQRREAELRGDHNTYLAWLNEDPSRRNSEDLMNELGDRKVAISAATAELSTLRDDHHRATLAHEQAVVTARASRDHRERIQAEIRKLDESIKRERV